MSSDQPQEERRSFYRVDQDVIFDYKVVDMNTVETREPEEAFDGGTALYLIGQMRKIDREAQKLLNVIAEKDRTTADYLSKLNSKVDLIARYGVLSNSRGHQVKRLNLSEGGVAFKGEKALYKDNLLVLRMIFLPSYTPVIVFAKVIRCEADGDTYRVAATFINLHELDRQELARQVIKTQASQRKRSTPSENTE